MEIRGKIHCMFEQSGVFKNEFRKLGYPALDYDIQNEFNETDNVIDLFESIEKAYDSKSSIFDSITSDDLIIAFFPCIFFCEANTYQFRLDNKCYSKMQLRERTENIIKRSESRDYYFQLATKLVCICLERNLRLIIENPYSVMSYLCNNFILPPTIIEKDRRKRGDYFKKPTAYWFINCKNTTRQTIQNDKKHKTIKTSKRGKKQGICSQERSMISEDYARNFICDLILGKEQSIGEPNLNFTE